MILFQCKVECGEGRQERNVSCVNSKEAVIQDELCKNISKPATVRQCVKHCGKWKYTGWSSVSNQHVFLAVCLICFFSNVPRA